AWLLRLMSTPCLPAAVHLSDCSCDSDSAVVATATITFLPHRLSSRPVMEAGCSLATAISLPDPTYGTEAATFSRSGLMYSCAMSTSHCLACRVGINAANADCTN